MIKKFFKFIFGLIIFVIILVVLVIVGLIIALTDKTDNAPIDKYDTSYTTETVLASSLNKSLNEMGTTYELNLLFDEDTLNQLLFAFVRKSLNPDFNPGKEDATTKEKYAYSFELPSDLPLVGGKAMGLKNIYGEIEGEDVTISITGDIDEKIKTRIYFTFNAKTEEDKYVLTIKELKIGKIDATGSLMKKALSLANLDLDGIINPALEKVDLPFVFNYEDTTLTSTKQAFSDWVDSILNKDEEGSSSDMKSEFLNLFLNPERSLINFGMFEENFGVKINLEGLKLDADKQDKLVLDDAVKDEFNVEDEMANKAQSLIINSLSATDDTRYLTFTELDFSRLIYTNMEGYKDFKIETEILSGVNFKFNVEGITFEIVEGTTLNINIILNINGLKTLAVLTGNINHVNDSEVRIELADKIQLGKDMEIGSAFMTEMLTNNFSDSSIMKFENNSLIFTTDVFNTFMSSAMGSSNSQLQVSKLQFVDGALRIYVTFDSSIGSKISNVTNLINNALKGDITLNSSDYNEDEAETVTEIQSELANIKDKLNQEGGTLSVEDTTALMESVNELSTESQAKFFEDVSKDIDEATLNDLYNSMFGN